MSERNVPPSRPSTLTLQFAGVEFHLEAVDRASFPARETYPVALLPDGTEVSGFRLATGCFLLIDHRAEPEGVCRIEFWQPRSAGEFPIAGMYVLGDARPPAPRRSQAGALTGG